MSTLLIYPFPPPILRFSRYLTLEIPSMHLQNYSNFINIAVKFLFMITYRRMEAV